MKPYLRIRYIFDWLIALLLIPFCIPFFALIIFIQFFVFGEVLFTQRRSGLHGKVFTLFKFKTMTDEESVTEKQRIVPWGKFLRNTGLDELPQILNVLSGDMVFIGPRPLLPEYNDLYSPEQKRRLDIKAGITGYAQALYRNDTTWGQRFEHDLYYVTHASLLLDIKIIYKSILLIFTKQEQEILERFEGGSEFTEF